MSTLLNWKKGVFACSYGIFSEGIKIGELKDRVFSRQGAGRLNDEQWLFKTKGYLRPSTQISDQVSGEVVGRIQYNCWYPKATIEYKGKTYLWKFSSWTETRWTISDIEGKKVKYCGYSHKGKIQMEEHDAFLALAGLVVANYYWELVSIYAAIFIPILFGASM